MLTHNTLHKTLQVKQNMVFNDFRIFQPFLSPSSTADFDNLTSLYHSCSTNALINVRWRW